MQTPKDDVMYCQVTKCDDPVDGHINWPLNPAVYNAVYKNIPTPWDSETLWCEEIWNLWPGFLY